MMREEINVPPEETLDPEDWESMRTLGHRILDDPLDYLKTLRDRPVWQHAPRHVKKLPAPAFAEAASRRQAQGGASGK